MFPPRLYNTRQVFDTFIWESVVHACSSQMLQASAAGGDIDESDRCCQVVEGDLREMAAPQWECGWVAAALSCWRGGLCQMWHAWTHRCQPWQPVVMKSSSQARRWILFELWVCCPSCSDLAAFVFAVFGDPCMFAWLSLWAVFWHAVKNVGIERWFVFPSFWNGHKSLCRQVGGGTWVRK